MVQQDILQKKYIYIIEKKFKSKKDFFTFLTTKLVENKIINKKNQNDVIEQYLAREKEGTTGFESGFAIPHCRSEFTSNPALLVFKLVHPINWMALDNKLTDKLFCIIVPKNDNQTHLEILSKIATSIMDNNFSEEISKANAPSELFDVISHFLSQEENNASNSNDSEHNPVANNILIVSACSYGLAHTYMAEKKAIEYAKAHHYNVKIETHGSKGVLNKITQEDLDLAQGVIIAVDKFIPLEHIKHKNIIKIRTIDLIKNPGKYFNEILSPQNKTKKEKIDEFFRISLYQKLFYSSGKGWNYLAWASFIIGILFYIRETNASFYPETMNNLFLFFSFGALLGPCIFTAYSLYILTKHNKSIFFITLFICSGLNIYQKFSNLISFNSQLDIGEWKNSSTIGIIGCAVVGFMIYMSWFLSELSKKYLTNKFIIKEQIIWLGKTLIYFFIVLINLLWIIKPLSDVNDVIYNWWFTITNEKWWFRWLLAFIFFELMIIDLGGPLNKWALVFSAILAIDSFSWNPTSPLLTPFTATSLAIPIPCFALGLRGVFLKNKLSSQERYKSKIALQGHFEGISEPALFALEDYKWKGYLANIIIALFGSLLISIFNLQFWGGFNNIWGIIFSFSTTGWGDSFVKLPFGNIAYAIVEIATILFGALVYTVLLVPIHSSKK